MSHATSAYTMELRYFMCPGCGAPIDVSPAGGTAKCRFCNVESHVAPRAKEAAFAPIPSPRMSEADRRNLLLGQIDHKLMPPSRVAHLFVRGSAPGLWRREEVFAAWQIARARTAAKGADAFEAAEELRFLTVVLGNEYLGKKDWVGHRAILESAFEAFFLVHHRSSIACDLVTGACRQKDLVGAKGWLAVCDPASEDLYADSSYRFARAVVAQHEQNFRDVIAVLGTHIGEVPIHDSLSTTATVARANALERLGAIPDAIRDLERQMGIGPSERRLVQTLAGRSSSCAQSLPIAVANVRQRASILAANTAGGEERHGLGAMFGARSARNAAAAETARRLAIEGLDARGHVLSIEKTGDDIDGLPLQRIRVRVDLGGAAPYEADIELYIGDEQAESLLDSVMFILVDGNDPRVVVAEAMGGDPT